MLKKVKKSRRFGGGQQSANRVSQNEGSPATYGVHPAGPPIAESELGRKSASDEAHSAANEDDEEGDAFL